MGRLSEVQLLVLLSFILQLFLFFTGGHRRRTRNGLLRGTIWLAYLGADVVAIYALGFLSRHADAMRNDDDASSLLTPPPLRLAHPLAFLWAPFLLIHLGGQDTITAFAIQDNNLWLRHLLNLLLQVTLALYVFWKSSSWHSTQVLVPGVLVFVAGIIKYAERAAALRHGNMAITSRRKCTRDYSSGDQQNPGGYDGTVTSIVCGALRSAPGIQMLFARRKTPQVASDLKKMVSLPSYYSDLPSNNRHKELFRLMDAELGMMYSEVYTKAAVLRTASGIVFRCISLACTAAALILFFFFSSRADHDTTNTYSGGGVDTIITYTLFIGGLVVDLCSLLTMVLASPWTWAWLRARGHRRIAAMCLRLVTVSGWVQGTTASARPLWSNTMGQYRFVCYDDDSQPWCSRSPPPPTPPERVMGIIRKLATIEEAKKLFWLSKLLETKHVAVEDKVTECLVQAIDEISGGGGGGGGWPRLGQMLLAVTTRSEIITCGDFMRLVSVLHACTEVLLCEAAAEVAAEAGRVHDATAADSADVCRKLSRYMVYLVAVHPAGDDLVQLVCGHPGKEYESWERYSNISLTGKQHQIRTGLLRLELEAAIRDCGCASSSSSSSLSRRILASSLPPPEHWKETLEELKRMWARLLVYAAAKSRPEAHAAELARGGELLTFVWLLLTHNELGATFQVDLVPQSSKHQSSSESASSGGAGPLKTYYAFKNLPAVQMVVNNCCPQLLLPPQEPSNNTDSSRIPPVKLAPSRVDL